MPASRLASEVRTATFALPVAEAGRLKPSRPANLPRRLLRYRRTHKSRGCWLNHCLGGWVWDGNWIGLRHGNHLVKCGTSLWTAGGRASMAEKTEGGNTAAGNQPSAGAPYRDGGRQPAARASFSEQNQRSPLLTSSFVLEYHWSPGTW